MSFTNNFSLPCSIIYEICINHSNLYIIFIYIYMPYYGLLYICINAYMCVFVYTFDKPHSAATLSTKLSSFNGNVRVNPSISPSCGGSYIASTTTFTPSSTSEYDSYLPYNY